MPDFKEILNRIQEFLKKLTTVQKLIIGGVVAAVIVAVVVVSGMSTQSTYSMLFRKPLSPEDYARVTKKLDEMGYSFSTKDDQFVLVKDEEEAKTIRMKLGQEGIIPSNVKGFELFDIQSFTTTDFERNVNLQRAIIGEMTRHLKALDDIEDVSIQISFPKERLYSDYQAPIEASVIITPSPFTDLKDNKKKVQGLINLVAFGIPELKKENIVIVDDKGNVLSDILTASADDEVKLAQLQLQIKAKEKAKIINDIRTAFAKAIPEQRLAISADIELDWTKESIKGDYVVPIVKKPDNPLTPYDDSEIEMSVPVSEKRTTEDFKGPAYIPEGPPGVDNNVPPGLKDKIDRYTQYLKNENIVNNRNSTELVEKEKAPFEIKKITVAVAIDGIWTIQRNDLGDPIITNGGRIHRIYTPVPEEEIRKYTKWVEGSVGYDPARGDKVVVNTIQFDHTAEFEAEDEKIRRKVQLRRTLIASIVVLFFLFIGTLVYRAVAREMERRRRLREEELARQQQAMREAALRAAEEEAATVELSIEEKARMELLENAINISRERPDDVARLIRTWLAEE